MEMGGGRMPLLLLLPLPPLRGGDAYMLATLLLLCSPALNECDIPAAAVADVAAPPTLPTSLTSNALSLIISAAPGASTSVAPKLMSAAATSGAVAYPQAPAPAPAPAVDFKAVGAKVGPTD